MSASGPTCPLVKPVITLYIRIHISISIVVALFKMKILRKNGRCTCIPANQTVARNIDSGQFFNSDCDGKNG